MLRKALSILIALIALSALYFMSVQNVGNTQDALVTMKLRQAYEKQLITPKDNLQSAQLILNQLPKDHPAFLDPSLNIEDPKARIEFRPLPALVR